MKTLDKIDRLELAKKSLSGIALGDAFGESFFRDRDIVDLAIQWQQLPETQWRYTDDTIMAIPIFRSLERFGCVDQGFVAKAFAENYIKDPHRGYGPSMHRKLMAIQNGENWLDLSKSSFNGQGSMGNGGAMRVALIGAYFNDDYKAVVEQAKLSCEITHYHQEAIAGAISVAIATAICTRQGELTQPKDWLDEIIEYTPESDLKYKLIKIKTLPKHYHIKTIVSALGNGVKMTAQDTVPLAIWNVYHEMFNFEAAMWRTVSALGDRDTTCAIAGGIAIMTSASEYIPKTWKEDVEDWEQSVFMS